MNPRDGTVKILTGKSCRRARRPWRVELMAEIKLDYVNAIATLATARCGISFDARDAGGSC